MALFLLLPLAGLAYVGWHVWMLVPLSHAWRWALIGVGVLSFCMIFLNFSRVIDRLPLWLARWVYDIGNSSIFVLLYLVMIFLVLDLGRLVHLVPKVWVCQNFYTTVALTLGMFALFLYGNIHYYNKVRVEMTLTTDKPLARPLTLVMMSDLHLGYHNPRRELARWVDMINAEHPDYVLIAGDIIDMSMRPLIEENMAEEFRRIQAPVYACLGNHEYYSGEPRARQFYHDAGIHLLRDTFAIVDGLCIIGRDDRTNPHRKKTLPLPLPVREGSIYSRTEESGDRPSTPLSHKEGQSLFSILLDHQPYHLEQAEQAGIDFQFSGHTHYGQVWPISWIEDQMYECAFGEHQRGRTRYYVSSGIGIWGGKYRIGTRSEYVVVQIKNN